jgi:Flp pilus assembly protein TadD
MTDRRDNILGTSLAQRPAASKNEPVREVEEDAPFSESMLEWLEQGDRLGEHPPNGVARPSGSHYTLESPRRRAPYIVGGVVVAVLGLMSFLIFEGKKAKREEALASAAAAASAPRPAREVPAPPPPGAPAVALAAAEQPVAAAPDQPVAEPAAAPAAAAPVAQAPAAEPAAPQAAAAAPAQPVAAEPAAAAPAPPVAAAPAAAEPPAPQAAPSAVAPGEPKRAQVPAPIEPSQPASSHPAKVAAAAPAAALAAAPSATDYDSAFAECRASMTAGRIQRAVTACRQATEARPRSSEALTLLAEAEFTRGHTGVALRLATEAANANQNFADAYVIIGGVYQEKGKNAEARAAYEQYLALQPKGKHAADLRAILGSL